MINKFIHLNWLTPKIAFIILIIFYIFFFITQGEPYVRSDGSYYYHTAECLIHEHNFVCQNRPVYWDYMESHTKSILSGKYVSVTSPGTAILNVPALAITNIFDQGKIPQNDYFMAYNGHTIFDGLAILLNSMFFSILGIILIFKTLKKLKFSDRNAILSITSVLLSSYALWYVFMNSIFTHTYEIFAVSLILFLFVSYQQKPRRRYLVALGAAIGLVVLVRPILLPIGLLLCLSILLKKQIKHLIWIAVGGIPFLITYLIYNYVSYGNFISSGYDAVRGETFTSNFNAHNLLFSINHGWLIYSPIFILAIIGLVLLLKRNKTLSLISLGSITIIVLIYGFWPAWWGGGSYGARFMLFAVPFGAIGLAMFLSSIKLLKYRKILYFLAIIFTLYSTANLILYRITPLDGNNTPLYFYTYQYHLFHDSGSLKEIIKKEISNLQGGSGNLILLTGYANTVFRIDETDNKIIQIRILYPPIKRSLPESISFILVDKNTNLQYSGKLTLNGSSYYEFTCDDTCENQNNFTFEKLSEQLNQLSISKYMGVKLVSSNIDIYFENSTGIQFRGDRIDWRPENPYYEVL